MLLLLFLLFLLLRLLRLCCRCLLPQPNRLPSGWNSLLQPSEFADSRVHDFFDIMYTSLSHKILDANTFGADAEALKHRFTDPDADDFIFKDAYAKDVPADGWALYAERIWVRPPTTWPSPWSSTPPPLLRE
jgi:hypothetical protein